MSQMKTGRYFHLMRRTVRRIDTRSRLSLAAFSLAIMIGAGLSMPWIVKQSTGLSEDISFAFSPSAERAFEYGERHLNGMDVINYDLPRARTYFYKAAALDPSLLYVHHQIARIAFLQGDFGTALDHINLQISLHGDKSPSSYYVRGLIEGYIGDYAAAAKDYEYFLKFRPKNWAGINDYAWVLLKAGRHAEAAAATEEALKYFPENPWLLNSSAIALYELGDVPAAHERVQQAWRYVQAVEEDDWLNNYPGNDPAIAGEGIATFRAAVADNMHRIELALASS